MPTHCCPSSTDDNSSFQHLRLKTLQSSWTPLFLPYPTSNSSNHGPNYSKPRVWPRSNIGPWSKLLPPLVWKTAVPLNWSSCCHFCPLQSLLLTTARIIEIPFKDESDHAPFKTFPSQPKSPWPSNGWPYMALSIWSLTHPDLIYHRPSLPSSHPGLLLGPQTQPAQPASGPLHLLFSALSALPHVAGWLIQEGPPSHFI